MARTNGGRGNMSAKVSEHSVYATQFSELAPRLPGRGLPWIENLRRSSIERFLDLGFPTTRLENWKYTNVAPISRTVFRPVVRAGSLPDSLRLQVDRLPSPRLVFIDGTPVRHEDSYLTTISGALADPNKAPILEQQLGRYAGASDNTFVAWNTAFFTDGACVVIPRGARVSEVICLVFVSTTGDDARATFPRNLIIVGEGSQVRFVELYLSAPQSVHLINAVTEIVAEPGAAIDYSKIESESSDSFHVATVKVSLARDASFTSHSFSFGAQLVRNDLDVALDGEGASCNLDGLFLVDGDCLVDNHTVIDHRKPHATSRELYKGVLAGRAEGVFNGAIIVRKEAQKTDAVQHSKNLLLSEHAQINTKPQLEIRADDVRCAHGASIGRLDKEALFY